MEHKIDRSQAGIDQLFISYLNAIHFFFFPACIARLHDGSTEGGSVVLYAKQVTKIITSYLLINSLVVYFTSYSSLY